jgi:hypothetical protein
MMFRCQPNGPGISCGDSSACAQTYVSFRTEVTASCMRLLGGTALRLRLRKQRLQSIPDILSNPVAPDACEELAKAFIPSRQGFNLLNNCRALIYEEVFQRSRCKVPDNAWQGLTPEHL